MKNPVLPETKSFTDTIREGTTPGIEWVLDRRTFCKASIMGIGGLAFANSISGCLGQIPIGDLYDKKPSNPNYLGQSRTFYDNTKPGAGGTPGVEYLCNDGTPMVASAAGVLHKWDSVGRGSGEYVELVHQPERKGRNHPFFATIYGHISVDDKFKKKYKQWDVVPRGTILGHVHYWGAAKLMAYEGSDIDHTYWVDPENYGPGYTQLDYWDNKTNLEVDNYGSRYNKQVHLLETFIQMYKGKDLSYLLKVPRSNIEQKQLHPAISQKFRKMEKIYQKEPEQFKATKEEISRVKEEFYANQPIKLTLCMVKP
ncbi:MAG: hypothetical protein ABIF10_06305 [Candidatus Woesearchaeota archaeon]